jgi:O-antigen/teichoic acid export membrane protein
MLAESITLLGALASYAPAMDLAGKAFLLPGVCLALLFPALGHHLAHAPEKAVAVYDASLRTLAWWMTPFLVLAVGVSGPAMSLWLGPTHGVAGGHFLAIFFVGLLCSLPGQIPFAAIQAVGKARHASILHALEVPVYVGGVWWALHSGGGLIAVAWTWSLRHLVDTSVMHLLVRRQGLKSPREVEFIGPLAIGLVLAGGLAALQGSHPQMALSGAVVAFGLWMILAWTSKGGQAAIPGFLRERLAPTARGT